MPREFIWHTNWDDATTLSERNKLNFELVTEAKSSSDPIVARAQATLDQWRSQTPFQNDLWFEKRLKSVGLTINQFFDLLKLSHDEDRPCSGEQLAWVSRIQAAYKKAWADRPNQNNPPGSTQFSNLVRPLVSQTITRLLANISENETTRSAGCLTPDTALVKQLDESIENILLPMVNRTCALELNLERLEGQLHGETSEDRFEEFIEKLSDPAYSFELLQRYPVLARQLVEQTDQWLDTTFEWMERLSADWPLITDQFGKSIKLGKLVSVNSSAGDRHCKGRSTTILYFDTGTKILYKPRPVAIDLHFQEFLEWINLSNHHYKFKIMKILDRGDYGWMEFISYEACESEIELKIFYERLGGLLAVLHSIDATDIHRENLIAAGEHPCLVDLETMLHPDVRFNVRDLQDGTIREEMNSSVLRSGLLPERLWGSDKKLGIDISGISGSENQFTPFGVKQWENSNTDKLCVVRKPALLSAVENRPSLNGKQALAPEYLKEIERGFKSTYCFFLDHLDELTSSSGPLINFCEDTIRVVLRPTRTYATFLSESYHPDLLCNSISREAHFDWLWALVEHAEYMEKVLPYEIDDLLEGNIPKFTTRANSKHLWTSSNVRIDDFFKQTPYGSVLNKTKSLNTNDLEKQLWFIKASISTLLTSTIPAKYRKKIPFRATVKSDPMYTPNQLRPALLRHACKIGDRLITLAYKHEKQANWVGLNYSGHEEWSLAPLELDLYGGIPGIALFLAYLGETTKNSAYTELARCAINSVLDRWKTSKIKNEIGGFEGLGGLIYTSWQLGSLWKANDLFEQTNLMIDELPKLLEIDNRFDVISGAAGCLAALLTVSRTKQFSHALDIASLCGEKLLSHSKTMPRGIGWLDTAISSKPLGGLSHGASGMAWALLSLARETRNPRFEIAGRSAIEYERSLFSKDQQNWEDRRKFRHLTEASGDPQFGLSWCHGAPGIGLSRIACLDMVDKKDAIAEINIAIETTIKWGFRGSHSLCHGAMGNFEILALAKQHDQISFDSDIHDQIMASIVSDMDRNGYRCGLPLSLSLESTGLLTGITGIGYGCLRMAFPEIIPNILLLEG